jgi:hypothetical protein
MNGDHDDRILEASLKEVLGGQYPPDLSAKILQELEIRQARSARDAVAGSPLPIPPPPAGFPHDPMASKPLIRSETIITPAGRLGHLAASSNQRRVRGKWQTRTTWASIAVVAGLLSVVVTIGTYLGGPWQRPGGSNLARSERLVTPGLDGSDSAERQFLPLPHREMPAPWTPDADPSARDEQRGLAAEVKEPARAGKRAEAAAAEVRAIASAPTRPERSQPWEDTEVIAFVDQMLRQQWQLRGVTPAPPTDEEQWCRRVYQRLVGREPSAGELRQFLSGPRNERRADLVDRLLASEDYARHWAGIWADVLLGHAGRDLDRLGIHREGFEQFLSASLAENRPYDQVVAELVSATGSCDPQSADHNAAANFLAASGVDQSGDKSVATTDRVSRLFLGKQLVCARCHNDPVNGWDQSEFWSLNAFFRQMKVQRKPEERFAVVRDQDFHGGTGIPKDAELFFPGEDGRLRLAYPEFGSETIARSGLLADVNRRHELARLLTSSPDFGTAAVNRIWAGLLTYGFVEPVDDAGPHNPPSYPELLGGLSEQLEAHGFDLKRLTRWIVLSRAFDVSDQRTPESWMDTPETGGNPLFARFYTEPSRPMDLHRSLMLAVHKRPAGSMHQAGMLARRSWAPGSPAIPQIIDTQGAETMLGPAWLERLAASRMSPDQKVEHLFQAVLDRKPTSKEATAAKLVLADRMDDRIAVRELWQILFSARSRWPHESSR